MIDVCLFATLKLSNRRDDENFGRRDERDGSPSGNIGTLGTQP